MNWGSYESNKKIFKFHAFAKLGPLLVIASYKLVIPVNFLTKLQPDVMFPM